MSSETHDPLDEIDSRALARWMDDAQLPGDGELPALSVMGGGTSNLIVKVARGGKEMILRRPPIELAQERNRTMIREFRILEALGGTDVPHPRVFGASEDSRIAGAWFYMSELVDGFSVMQLKEWPKPFDDHSLRPELALELVRGIAKLARVDWKAAGLRDLGRPEGFHERQADRWSSHLEKYRFRDIPGFDETAAWLRSHQPRHYEPGIMHGDYQFANVMFRHGAPARLAAIIDWEMGTVGDPLVDLAWVLMGWPDADEDRTQRGYADYNGMPDRDDLVEEWTSVSGRAADDLPYTMVLARFKMAAVLEPSYARFVDGTSKNPMHEYFGQVVLDQAAAAAELAASIG
ncbi:MAG: phosphotransferase family protein [Acidimicrobiales bacterium]|nr:phosphotransferase family protein [Acidimicrobiales bacterium]